jgi:hypothetical protein
MVLEMATRASTCGTPASLAPRPPSQAFLNVVNNTASGASRRSTHAKCSACGNIASPPSE